MQCPRCQHENPLQAKFCLECGTRLAVKCMQCGTELPAGAKFCLECAHPVAGPPSVELRFASPESYTPRHLAERILTSKSALEGERKLVTVLFADLKGSMELLADRDPEEARKILDPVLERVMEAVHRYEGTVNQVMGDGIMALFGAPLAHEDHAVRACYAALRMQESVKRYANETRRTHGVEVEIRVGLNSGEVVVRSIGSDLRMDYTAVGQTTHLAARMEQMASPGTIRLTADTLRMAEGYVEVKPLGPIPVKGLAEPVEVYELTGAGLARTRLQAAAIRGLTRFVGRDAEVEHLRRVLARTGDGHGQVVAIVGEAGVGKSRLVYEFTQSHRVQDWLVLEAASVSYGKATSYLPVIDLLKGHFKIGDRDDHREMRAKVLGRVLGLDRALEPLLPPLLALLDVPVEDPAWQALDPPQRRQRTLDAVKRLLLRESQVQPLLVVFEDLHWIDGETQALLDSLVESLGSARLLLLVTYRPEYEHRWGSKTSYSQLRLDSLPVESTVELLNALLGADPGLERLKQMLVKRGNPFFLEETVRTLVETGALAGERGAYRLTRPVEALQVPATVQTILAARIDRLPVEEKQVLQAAAVIGKDVPSAILQAIADQPEEALRRGLAHLQEAEFLYEARLFPDLEYTFKHALTHEVTYGSLLGDRRRQLHAQIVGAMERLYPDRLPEYVERLGHHALRGEVWEKAVDYLRATGAKLYLQGALPESVDRYEQALAAASRLSGAEEDIRRQIDLRLECDGPLFALGQIPRLTLFHQEAERLARSIGDVHRLARAATRMGVYAWNSAKFKETIRYAEEARSIAETLDDREVLIMSRYLLGFSRMSLGDHRAAIECLTGIADGPDQELAKRVRTGTLTCYVGSCTAAGWVFGLLGDFAAADRYAAAAVEDVEQRDEPIAAIGPLCYRGLVLGLQGEFSRAVSWGERAAQLCEERHFTRYLSMTLTGLGWLLASSGRVAEALRYLERAAAVRSDVGIVGSENAVFQLSVLGAESLLRAGAASEGLRLARDAVRVAAANGERAWVAWGTHVLGEATASAERPDLDSARHLYGRAEALATELGMRPLVAHCHLGLGKLYRRAGKRDQARDHLNKATAMYREMTMRFWLEQAEAELGRPVS